MSFPVDIKYNDEAVVFDELPGFVLDAKNLEGYAEAFSSPQPGDRAAGDGLPQDVVHNVELKELGTMEVEDIDPLSDEPKTIDIYAKTELLEEENMVLYTDEDGIVSLHFPEALDSSPDNIDLDGAITQFSVELRKPTEAAPSGDRGTFGVIGKKILKVVGWKGVGKAMGRYGPKLIRAWEKKYRPMRIVEWDDVFFSDDSPDFDGLIPASKENEKTLLFVHGTASRLSAAFHGLDNNLEFKKAIEEQYSGRILGYDHPTLATGIATNIMQFYEKLAPGKHVFDIICHSRGGPVSRSLRELSEDQLKAGFLRDAERGNYEERLVEWGKQWHIPDGVKVVVDRIIFAGSTNNGTTLAKKGHLKKYVELMLTLANLLPDGVDITVDILLTVAKTLVGDMLPVMPGLDDQSPESKMLSELKQAPSLYDAGLVANFEPGKTLQAIADEILDKIFLNVENDIVVPAKSVSEWQYGNAIKDDMLLYFGKERGAWHSSLFSQEESSGFILEKLGT
ncbi:MAG: hypothetical protein GY755_23190 [Chloroflexi bacterium]|nr:hypothetical protein [Chloroflexota bacterium]